MCNSREEFQMETIIDFLPVCIVGEMCSNLLQNKKQIRMFQAIKDKLIYPSASSSSLCFFPHRTETLQKKNSYLASYHIFWLH